VIATNESEGSPLKPGESWPLSDWYASVKSRPTQPTVLDDLAALPALSTMYRRLVEAGIRTYLSVPLIVDAKPIGELGLGRRTLSTFAPQHVEIAGEIANQLAVAFHHIHIHDQLRRYTVQLEERIEERTDELNRSRDRAEAILNHSSDAIILAYSDGTINQTNPAFDRLFQYAPDELFRQPLSILADPEYASQLNAAVQAVSENGEVQHLEFSALRKGSEAFHAEIGLSRIHSHHIGRDGLVCSVHDITQRKQAEEELRKALEKEKELSELKSRFVSMASHEIRTPLTSIVSSTELLQLYEGSMTPEQKERHFARIQSAARYMTQLLEDVLLYSKAEANRLLIDLEAVDMQRLGREVLNEAKQHAANNQVNLTFNCTGADTPVQMDEKLVRHILANLVSNSIKYSPNGGQVQLDIDCQPDQIRITISDQGIGIPEAEQEHIFEPFFRAENVGAVKGTGLGLAITKRAIELHRGTIRFESKPEVGTTFFISIPILENQEESDPVEKS